MPKLTNSENGISDFCMVHNQHGKKPQPRTTDEKEKKYTIGLQTPNTFHAGLRSTNSCFYWILLKQTTHNENMKTNIEYKKCHKGTHSIQRQKIDTTAIKT